MEDGAADPRLIAVRDMLKSRLPRNLCLSALNVNGRLPLLEGVNLYVPALMSAYTATTVSVKT